MAIRPPKACSRFGCNKTSVYKGGCEDHRPAYHRVDKQSSKYQNDKFYNSAAWKLTRRTVLMEEPLCRLCRETDTYTEAAHVDHIIRATHVENKHDLSNLMPLCVSCHSRKTNREEIYYDGDRYVGDGRNPYEKYRG